MRRLAVAAIGLTAAAAAVGLVAVRIRRFGEKRRGYRFDERGRRRGGEDAHAVEYARGEGVESNGEGGAVDATPVP